MAQPKTAPLSVRLGEARLARIDAFAAEHKLARHLAILVLVDKGLAEAVPPVFEPIPSSPADRDLIQTKAWLAEQLGAAHSPTSAAKIHVSVPYAGDVRQPIYQKGKKS